MNGYLSFVSSKQYEWNITNPVYIKTLDRVINLILVSDYISSCLGAPILPTSKAGIMAALTSVRHFNYSCIIYLALQYRRIKGLDWLLCAKYERTDNEVTTLPWLGHGLRCCPQWKDLTETRIPTQLYSSLALLWRQATKPCYSKRVCWLYDTSVYKCNWPFLVWIDILFPLHPSWRY